MIRYSFKAEICWNGVNQGSANLVCTYSVNMLGFLAHTLWCDSPLGWGSSRCKQISTGIQSTLFCRLNFGFQVIFKCQIVILVWRVLGHYRNIKTNPSLGATQTQRGGHGLLIPETVGATRASFHGTRVVSSRFWSVWIGRLGLLEANFPVLLFSKALV